MSCISHVHDYNHKYYEILIFILIHDTYRETEAEFNLCKLFINVCTYFLSVKITDWLLICCFAIHVYSTLGMLTHSQRYHCPHKLVDLSGKRRQ